MSVKNGCQARRRQRRQWGEGSIYQRKGDGRWVAAVSVQGRHRVRYASSRTEALERLRELVAAKLITVPDVPLPPAFPVPAAGAATVAVPAAIANQYRHAAEEQGWKVRSVAEARVAYRLARYGLGPDQVVTQAKVGAFRLDFALPDVLVAIEVDGPMHRLPEHAAKDLSRDLWLNQAGWMVFRVDAYADEKQLAERLVRIVRFVRAERLG